MRSHKYGFPTSFLDGMIGKLKVSLQKSSRTTRS